MLLLLAGCGFQPVHGQRVNGGGPAATEFAAISIATIPDRIGQLVRNELLDQLTPRGEPANPRYRLQVSLKSDVYDMMIRRDATASRARLTLTATYRLTAGDQAVTDGTARAMVSYDLPAEASFATIASERDGERQAAKAVAEQITSRLAAHFAKRS